jgi:hypothetical protein
MRRQGILGSAKFGNSSFVFVIVIIAFLRRRIGRVADDFTLNPVNDFFGDVGGMIRQSL